LGLNYQEAKAASKEFKGEPSLFARSQEQVYLPRSTSSEELKKFRGNGVSVHLFGDTLEEAEVNAAGGFGIWGHAMKYRRSII